MSEIPPPDMIEGTAFDYELVVSRDSPIGSRTKNDSAHSIPVYFDGFRNKFYLSLSEEDDDYYREIRRAERGTLIDSYFGHEMLEYPQNDPRYGLDFPVHKLLEIPGVVADQFILKKGVREYWRFRFFKENVEDVSSFLLNRSSNSGESSGTRLMLEYLGKPRSLRNYLKQMNYGRRVSVVTLLEKIDDKYIQTAPHYKYPFTFLYKAPNFGQGFSVTVRISKGKISNSGLIKEQKEIRGDTSIITEEKRDSVMDSAYLDFDKKFFLPFIGMQCDYDGRLSTTTAIIDSFKMPQFLPVIRDINKKEKGLIKFIIQSVETYYDPQH